MPLPSRIAIRAAMGWLVTGALIGVLSTGARCGFGLFPPVVGSHAEAMLIGWFLQFVFGVAYWILPKHPPERGSRRGSRTLALLALCTMNLSVLVSLAGAQFLVSGLIAAGRLVGVVAAVLGGLSVGPRVKPFAT